jgi:hypothetical protein
MARSFTWIVVFAAALLLAATRPLVAWPQATDPVRADNSAPPSIPISTVEDSKNCDGIAKLEGQLEGPPIGKDIRPIEGPGQSRPLGASGKFHLAVKNVTDPLNIAGTVIDSAISNATSSANSDFGTGWSGFGRRVGMSMADEGVSEFISTFAISTIAHQDPHYHRDPGASKGRRILYALSRVVIARSDSGKPMFNFAEVAGTTASSFLEATYNFNSDRPGAVSNRVLVSIGSDAGWNLMSEFLPDIAGHINPRFVFLRRLAERAAKQP